MDLDLAAGIDQKHLTTLAKAEVADHFRHGLEAEAQTGDAEGFAALLDPLVDKQGGQSRALVDVDFQHPIAAAVDQIVEPLVLRLIAADDPRQPLAGGVVAAGKHGNRGGHGVLLRTHPFQITGHGIALLGILACGQPVLHQGVLGDAGIGGNRATQHPFQIVADRQNPGRQRFLDQIAFGEAVYHRRVHPHHDQDAGQQGRPHAENQLQLDTAPPELHGGSPLIVIGISRIGHTAVYKIQAAVRQTVWRAQHAARCLYGEVTAGCGSHCC